MHEDKQNTCKVIHANTLVVNITEIITVGENQTFRVKITHEVVKIHCQTCCITCELCSVLLHI